MAENVFHKDPEAVLDYSIDWTAWLDGDTISVSAWTVPAGITQDSASASTTGTTIWLSGGAAGETYTLVNHITTAAGREDDRTIRIKVREK